MDIKANENKFQELLKSTNRKGIDFLLSWLIFSDFYQAPASTYYHGNYEGGLCQHSLTVYKILSHKIKSYKKALPEDSVIITALLHDICKINYYDKELKNVKKSGEWTQKEVYVVKDELPLGHGEKSVILAQKYIELTDIEMLMIRWHMGGFTPVEQRKDLSAAIAICPEIILLATSDYESLIFEETK